MGYREQLPTSESCLWIFIKFVYENFVYFFASSYYFEERQQGQYYYVLLYHVKLRNKLLTYSFKTKTFT